MRKNLYTYSCFLLLFCSSVLVGQTTIKRNYSLNSGIAGLYYQGLHGKIQNSQVFNFDYRYEKIDDNISAIGLNISNTNKKVQREIEYTSASTQLEASYQYLWQREQCFHGLELQSNFIINFFPKLNTEFLYWNSMNSIRYSTRQILQIQERPLVVDFNISLFNYIAESRFKRIVSENEQTSKEPVYSHWGTFPSITNLDVCASYPVFKILNQQMNFDLTYKHAQFPSNNGQTLTIIQILGGLSTSF